MRKVIDHKIISVSIILAIFICIIYIAVYFIPDNIWRAIVISFSVNVTTALLLVILGIDILSKAISEWSTLNTKKQNLGMAYNFWDVPSKNKQWVAIFGGFEYPLSHDIEWINKMDGFLPGPTIETVNAYVIICECIRTILSDKSIKIPLIHIKTADLGSMLKHGHNVILLGGIHSIPDIIQIIMTTSNLGILQTIEDQLPKINTDKRTLKILNIPLKSRFHNNDPNIISEDYCSVLRIANKDSSIFAFSGGFACGTLGGVKAFTGSIPGDIKIDTSSQCSGCIVRTKDVEYDNPDPHQDWFLDIDGECKSETLASTVFDCILEHYKNQYISADTEKTTST